MLRCPTCPYKGSAKPPVAATGPSPARVMVLAEAPGRQEVQQGRVLVGKTGQELDKYLADIGLQRDDVYCTNAMHCAPLGSKGKDIGTPTQEQARACASYFLPIELREVQPDVIVLLGAVAGHALLGDSLNLEMQHGLPFQYTADSTFGNLFYLGCGPIVIPMYHPAAGLRDGEWMIALQEDFGLLRRHLRGEVVHRIDTTEHQCRELTAVRNLDDVFETDLEDAAYIALDTEYVHGTAWCVTFSLNPGFGWFISATRTDLLLRLAYWLDKFTVILHNALADLPILAQMGLRPRRWIDTQVLAYWAQEFRQGLKILAYRLVGMQMQDYDDVVKPSSKIALYTYTAETIDAMTRAVPDNRKIKSMTDDERAVRKTRTLLKRLITDLEKDWAKVDPWTRIDNWQPETVRLIQNVAGKVIPEPNISLVDRQDAIRYSTTDAIATLRIRPVLAERARQLRKRVA